MKTQSYRDGFVAGARAALDAMAIHLRRPQIAEMGEWIEVDLAAWTRGPAPLSPAFWTLELGDDEHDDTASGQGPP